MTPLSYYLLVGISYAGALVITGKAAKCAHQVRRQAEARGATFIPWLPYVALGLVMLAWPAFLVLGIVIAAKRLGDEDA